MATDYILFVHGVNTRERRETPEYADKLFEKIEKNTPRSGRTLKKIALYWGDVNVDEETRVLKNLKASPLWSKMWFKEFREKQILQFAGDAALYISRHIGAKVVEKLKKGAVAAIGNPKPDDYLHLVTHSWGTVILFDVLFAGRWNQVIDGQNVPGYDNVMSIRDGIFGISGNDTNTQRGIKLASIHTMGSPVAIFSLTNVVPGHDPTGKSPSSHDITPQLQKLLASLNHERQGKKLPWRNYVHPGDPIAYPIEQLMTDLVDGDKKFLDIRDLLTYEAGIFDFLTEPVSQTALALLHGGDAHGSYWQSEQVAQEISKTLAL